MLAAALLTILIGHGASQSADSNNDDRDAAVVSLAGDEASVVREAQTIRVAKSQYAVDLTAYKRMVAKFDGSQQQLDAIERAKSRLDREKCRLAGLQDELRLRMTFLDVAPDQVDIRLARVKQLRDQREKISRLLRKLMDNSPWDRELRGYIQECNKGRFDVYMTASSVLTGGLAKSLGELVENNTEVAKRFAVAGRTYAREIDAMEEKLAGLMRGSPGRPALQRATGEMRKIHEALESARARRDDAARVFHVVEASLQSGARLAQLCKASGELSESFRRDTADFLKQSLAVSSAILVSTLASEKADVLERAGQAAAAIPIRYAMLALDVAAQAANLRVLSRNVDECLRSIDDLNAARATLGRHVVAASDEIQTLRREISAWNGPSAHSVAQIRALLSLRN
jgi:hypothetical protein